MNRQGAPGTYLFVEALTLCVGLRMKPLGEGLLEPLVLEERLSTLTCQGIQAHQGGMHLFSGGLFREHPLQGFYAPLIFPTLLVETGQFDE
jgi:hypothetical protein